MPAPRGMRRGLSASTEGRIAAATVKAKKSSTIRSFSFQRASAVTTTAVNTIAATNARRAVSVTQVVSPGLDERKPAGNRALRGEGRFVLADAQEEIFLEARRHGIVLARPLFWAVALAVVGGVLATLPWPLPLGGFVVLTGCGVVALWGVTQWE